MTIMTASSTVAIPTGVPAAWKNSPKGTVKANVSEEAPPYRGPDFGQQPSLFRENTRGDAATGHLPTEAHGLRKGENGDPMRLV